MPIIAKESSEKITLDKGEINSLKLHAKHSTFHTNLLIFYNKHLFLTKKQSLYINTCNTCRDWEDEEEFGRFGWNDD